MMFPPHQTVAAPMKPVRLKYGYQPSPFDVCNGRGKKNWNHEGNTVFRKLIRSNVQRYQATEDKQEKAAIVISIVDTIRQHGGRFLKLDDDEQWYDMGDIQAREKVGHSLRDQVNAQLKQQQQQSTEMSPRKRDESPKSASGDMVSLKRPRKSKKLQRSTSCPTKSSSNDAAPQQGWQNAPPDHAVSRLLEPLPIDGQIVPSFIRVSNHQPISGLLSFVGADVGVLRNDGVDFSQASIPQESLSSFPQESLSNTDAGMANLGLAPEHTTPNQGRVQLHMPDFMLPLDASMEPTPILEKELQSSKDRDSQKPANRFPPRPPFH